MGKSYICEAYEDEVSDRLVWEWLGEGDVRALKTLFLRYHDYLYYYASKLGGNPLLAEDCVHDLFFRLWNRREHLGVVQSVKSYLWVSLRRDVLRAKNGHLKEVLTEDMVRYSSQLRFSPEEFIIHMEQKKDSEAALTKALNQLPARQREAIFLKYFNGMGYDEIEMIMGINYQTARNYVSDGVQNLKVFFKEKSESPVPYLLSVYSICFSFFFFS